MVTTQALPCTFSLFFYRLTLKPKPMLTINHLK
jgi:hypothetical protein